MLWCYYMRVPDAVNVTFLLSTCIPPPSPSTIPFPSTSSHLLPPFRVFSLLSSPLLFAILNLPCLLSPPVLFSLPLPSLSLYPSHFYLLYSPPPSNRSRHGEGRIVWRCYPTGHHRPERMRETSCAR